ncbi:hypothetical protein [Pedobacter sp. Leaf176]|uniref:hypothetical protein n=1 Tax=unclassified Pedobacter TaxID=2628915 RepID=UPI0006F60FA1|nr:hypothetical protein [Pedobacter sp. Leaf176]KQR68373.1 hypothetical protein ASF92_16045 [Pedobacter sp. Leaf176]
MNFTLDKATELVNHYQFLIGEPLDNSQRAYPITDLAIVPDDAQKISTILSELENGNNMMLLAREGYEPKAVRIVVAHIDNYNGNVVYNCINDYIETYNIEKAY